MKSISQVGENRLSRILAGDKNQSPERFCELLKSDVKMLMENYAELSGDIEIELEAVNDEFVFVVKCKAVRMKTLGIIP